MVMSSFGYVWVSKDYLNPDVYALNWSSTFSGTCGIYFQTIMDMYVLMNL